MNSLEKPSLIKKENLDQSAYCQSLLQEAYRVRLLTDLELNRIQVQSIELLAREAERFTGGASSSVRVETAENIIQSLLYTIGVYLQTIPNPDHQLQALKEQSLSDLYLAGKKLVTQQIAKAKHLFSIVRRHSLTVNNYAYNATLQEGIPLFFSTYDPEFAAHDTPGSIDYPLSNDHMDQVGVTYIYSYLQKLYYEDHFCRKFSFSAFHPLLAGYSRDYPDLLINLFELVLTNALGSILANKQAIHLNMGSPERAYLQDSLEVLPPERLTSYIHQALQRLFKDLNISSPFLQKYIEATTVNNIRPRLEHSLATRQLEKVFIGFPAPPSQANIHFEESPQMDDESFRRVAEEIRTCRHLSDKLIILKRNLHNITDLIDLLEDSCFFGDEFFAVFHTLDDPVLALLWARLPMEATTSDLLFLGDERECYLKLSSFLEGLAPTRKKAILELAEKIERGPSSDRTPLQTEDKGPRTGNRKTP